MKKPLYELVQYGKRVAVLTESELLERVRKSCSKHHNHLVINTVQDAVDYLNGVTMVSFGVVKHDKVYTSYDTAITWCDINAIQYSLKMQAIDKDIVKQFKDNVYNNVYGSEVDIYDYYLTNATDFEVDYLKSAFSDMYFLYSDTLDAWVLGVSHGGTSWTQVEVEVYDEQVAQTILSKGKELINQGVLLKPNP